MQVDDAAADIVPEADVAAAPVVPRALLNELASLSPTYELLAAGSALMAENKRRSFRQPGEQSYSRHVASMLFGDEARAVGLWEWLAEQSQLDQIAAMFDQQITLDSNMDQKSRARNRKWVRGARSLLEPEMHTRWGLLKATATRLYERGYAHHPGVSAEEQLILQLIPCWAWCGRCSRARLCSPSDVRCAPSSQGRAWNGHGVSQAMGRPEAPRHHGRIGLRLWQAIREAHRELPDHAGRLRFRPDRSPLQRSPMYERRCCSFPPLNDPRPTDGVRFCRHALDERGGSEAILRCEF